MSTDSLPARSNGQTIDETWFNIIRTILSGDYVPRNTAGAATTIAGSLGTDTYRWLNLNLVSSGVITIGSSTVTEGGGKIQITDNGGNAFSVSEITTNLIGAAADNSTDMGAYSGTVLTASQSIKTNIQELETQLDITDLLAEHATNILKYDWENGITLNDATRIYPIWAPTEVNFGDAEADWTETTTSVTVASGESVYLNMGGLALAASGTTLRARIYRDAVNIKDYSNTITGLSTAYQTLGTNYNVGVQKDKLRLFYADATPGAGTYVYKLTTQRSGGSGVVGTAKKFVGYWVVK